MKLNKEEEVYIKACRAAGIKDPADLFNKMNDAFFADAYYKIESSGLFECAHCNHSMEDHRTEDPTAHDADCGYIQAMQLDSCLEGEV